MPEKPLTQNGKLGFTFSQSLSFLHFSAHSFSPPTEATIQVKFIPVTSSSEHCDPAPQLQSLVQTPKELVTPANCNAPDLQIP
jgi:hypothetical protein